MCSCLRDPPASQRSAQRILNYIRRPAIGAGWGSETASKPPAPPNAPRPGLRRAGRNGACRPPPLAAHTGHSTNRQETDTADELKPLGAAEVAFDNALQWLQDGRVRHVAEEVFDRALLWRERERARNAGAHFEIVGPSGA